MLPPEREKRSFIIWWLAKGTALSAREINNPFRTVSEEIIKSIVNRLTMLSPGGFRAKQSPPHPLGPPAGPAANEKKQGLRKEEQDVVERDRWR